MRGKATTYLIAAFTVIVLVTLGVFVGNQEGFLHLGTAPTPTPSVNLSVPRGSLPQAVQQLAINKVKLAERTSTANTLSILGSKKGMYGILNPRANGLQSSLLVYQVSISGTESVSTCVTKESKTTCSSKTEPATYTIWITAKTPKVLSLSVS